MLITPIIHVDLWFSLFFALASIVTNLTRLVLRIVRKCITIPSTEYAITMEIARWPPYDMLRVHAHRRELLFKVGEKVLVRRDTV